MNRNKRPGGCFNNVESATFFIMVGRGHLQKLAWVILSRGRATSKDAGQLTVFGIGCHYNSPWHHIHKDGKMSPCIWIFSKEWIGFDLSTTIHRNKHVVDILHQLRDYGLFVREDTSGWRPRLCGHHRATLEAILEGTQTTTSGKNLSLNDNVLGGFAD